jgi:hypothetical protein
VQVVGGSNPLAPTNPGKQKSLLPCGGGFFVLRDWERFGETGVGKLGSDPGFCLYKLSVESD